MVGIGFGGVAPIAVAAALVALRGHIQNANVALILTLVVVAAGATGGRIAGVTSAVSAALSFNFFHTRPYLSLTIASSDDVETTVLLLLVGLAVGSLAWRLRNTGEELAAGRSELQRLSRVGDLVARGADPVEVIFAAQSELTGLLGLAGCSFEAAPGTTPPRPSLERTGVITGTSGVHRFTRHGFELPSEGVELPVLSQGRPVGRFLLAPSAGVGTTLEARIVAVALADQVGAALSVKPLTASSPSPSSHRQHERGN